MSQLLLVGNPARRRKTRSAAQKRATAKMLAANRSKRHAAPKRKRARSIVAVTSNPAPRRRRASVKRVAKRRARRNPISTSLSIRSITAQLKNAGIGAAGALGVDVAYGFASGYLPDMVKSPLDATGKPNYAYYAAKGLAAIGIGMAAKKLIGANRAAQLVEGSLTVTAHDLMKQLVTSNFAGVTLGYASPARQMPFVPQSQALNGVGTYLSNSQVANRNLNAYVPQSQREVLR
jgi:hypothetical protein